jgi:hypothetical protein
VGRSGPYPSLHVAGFRLQSGAASVAMSAGHSDTSQSDDGHPVCYGTSAGSPSMLIFPSRLLLT